MTELILLLLPSACDRNQSAAHWWRVTAEGIAEHGQDSRWVELCGRPGRGAGLTLIALAPVADVRLVFPEAEGSTERQLLGVARARALAASLAEPATLHAVAGRSDGQLAVALVANGKMVEWLDWLDSWGVNPAGIVPAGLLVPRTGQWMAAALGPEAVLARDELVLADEPALREALVGEEPVTSLSAAERDERLLELARQRPLDLRVGRFAKRRLWVLDWGRVRELAAIALALPLLGLLIAIVMIVRLERSSDNLDAESARLASEAVGREVTAASATAALDQRITSVPGASGSPFVPLTAVYSQMQQVPGTTLSALSWRPDGTLQVALAATRTEDINRFLLALQRDGYRVTATSRAGPSGQVIADITVRSTQ